MRTPTSFQEITHLSVFQKVAVNSLISVNIKIISCFGDNIALTLQKKRKGKKADEKKKSNIRRHSKYSRGFKLTLDVSGSRDRAKCTSSSTFSSSIFCFSSRYKSSDFKRQPKNKVTFPRLFIPANKKKPAGKMRERDKMRLESSKRQIYRKKKKTTSLINFLPLCCRYNFQLKMKNI